MLLWIFIKKKLIHISTSSQLKILTTSLNTYQILMAPEDMMKTTFVTEWGIYSYTVMSFGLKNAGATYQRMATTLLHDMMHKEV